jgi:hypothetical protein
MLAVLRLVVAVLLLAERAAAGDEDAVKAAEELAARLGG